jgi:hypothetical protein
LRGSAGPFTLRGMATLTPSKLMGAEVKRKRRQHAVVDHQIGPRPRNQRRELLQQRERLGEPLRRTS